MKKGVLIAGSFVVLSAFLCVGAILLPTDEIETDATTEVKKETEAVGVIVETVVETVARIEIATPTPAADRCEAASMAMVETIRAGVKDISQTNDVEAETAVAVKSNAFESVWFVAVKITGENIPENTVGVWAIGGTKEQPGLTVSVDEIAKNFSVYPSGDRSQWSVTMDDDGARIAENCLR